MPEARFKHVVSFSSEDPMQPATNLLKAETFLKWRCHKGEESKAIVCLQLEKSFQITSVDIGNNGSAFVEVLVGRSTWQTGEAFKVLIAASMFMSPAESKSGQNVMGVRLFGSEKLNKAVANEKWDQIQIVCTQPYCNTSGYGLSFIKLHVVDEQSDKDTIEDGASAKKKMRLGRFSMNSDSEEESSTPSVGRFFERRHSSSGKTQAQTRPIHAPVQVPRDVGNVERKTPNISIGPADRQEVAAALLTDSTPHAPQDTSVSKAVTPKNAVKSTTQNKRMVTSKPKKKTQKVKTEDILKGVIFVLSGYENPERGNIRDLALSMGAVYEAGWNKKCTHLICAFRNTPKFKQVQGKGKIVSKVWIDDCYKMKKRLPTSSYRLDGGGDSSDDDDELDESGDSSDEEFRPETQGVIDKENEYDTEDELEEIRKSSSKGESSVKRAQQTDDPMNSNLISLSEESVPLLAVPDKSIEPVAAPDKCREPVSSFCEMIEAKNKTENVDNEQLPVLPDFFTGMHFLVYGEIEQKELRAVKRYITAYGGALEEYMGENVGYILTKENWDAKFEEALKEYPKLVFLKPKWILDCHQKQRKTDIQTFRISP